MATIVWTGAAGDGNFNNAANWSPSQVPGAGDTVTISPAAVTAIGVANDSVGALTTNAKTTLNLANGASFTIGSAAGGATTFSNGGTFTMDSSNGATDLIVGATSLTLTGGGTIMLSDNGNNFIEGATASSVLDNVNNLIEGTGQLGNGTLTFINGAAGVVDADGTGALVLNTGAKAITNSGLIESTGTGGVVLNSVVNGGTTGKISAAGGNVYLQGGTIEGGIIESSGGAAVIDNGGGTLDGTPKTVTIDGSVVVANGSALSLLGVITNNGTISLASSNGNTDLVIGPSGKKAGTVTLAGKGQVVLSDNANNFIYGAIAGDTLLNKTDTISGGGSFTGPLTLINDATIDATANTALVLAAGVTVTNNKLLEATLAGGGGLVIETTVNSSTTGTVLANGGNVNLAGGTLQGGTIKTANGGVVVDTSTATLDGTAHTVTNDGTVAVVNGAGLTLLGTITNAGTIMLQSTNGGTDLLAGPSGSTVGTVTLTGGGVVSTTDNGNNAFSAATAGDTLINLNNKIEGAGAFTGPLTLVNDGTIDATDANALVVDTAGTVTNNALMEATLAGGGGLVIETTVNSSGGGTILAAGGNVYLAGGTLVGGTMNSSGGGAVVDSGGGTLNGLTQGVTNLGSFVLNNGQALSVEGSLVNDGTMSLTSNNGATELYVASASVSLTGGGTITLSNNSNNYILGTVASNVLDNVNNTIEGGGQLGYGTLTLVNAAAGVIDADQTAGLTLNTGTIAVTNSGLIEATAGGVLAIYDTTVNNSTGGTILAAGGTVELNGGVISGGTINSSGSGEIVTVSTGELNGLGHAVTNLGTVGILNGTQLNVTGSIVNDGLITLNSTNPTTELELQSPRVTLSGAGTIAMSDNINNYIYGAAASDVLDNLNNTIEGSGQIGDDQMTLINGAAGVISATGTNSQLVINTGANAVSNSGLLEAVGPAGLQIQSTVVNNGAKAVISAAGGNVYLNGATIEGGKLTASGGAGFIDLSTAVLDGTVSTVTNDATIAVNNGQTLYMLGTITNAGTITLNSSNSTTELQVGPAATAGTVTLTGGGQVVMSNNSNNYIFGQIAGDTLINLNNTISGGGIIGNDQLVLINDATIDANTGTALTIDTGNTVTNNALLESTSTGGLVITNSTISNGTKGTISAAGGGVVLNGATVQGGLLTGSGGFFDVGTATLDGTAVSVTIDSTVAISNGQEMLLLGTIVNTGTISVNSSNSTTELQVGPAGAPGTVTLTGGGQIVMTDNGNNYIFGQVAGDTLINLNNTISGAGNIGNNQLTLINDATIDATGGNALTLETTVAITNNALIEATGSGGLSIVNTTVNNGTLGTILASTGNVYLSSAVIQGGTLAGAGTFYDTNNATLDGTAHALNNLGNVLEDNSANLYLEGTINNQATITEDSTNATTELIIESSVVTLTGGGTLSISDNGNNYIFGNAAADVLDNVNNTIEGAGNLGNGQLTLVDGGIIAATGGNALSVDLGSTGTITASGEFLGIGSGGLSISNGTYTNLGLIEAENGSSVTIQSSAVLTNSVNGTLTGGTYVASATGNGATLNLGGTAITTDSAQIAISGAGAVIESGGVSLGASLDVISHSGVFALLDDANYTTTANGGVLTDNGLMILEGGTYTGTTLTVASGATLSGFGTLASSVVNNGTISIAGGQMVFDGPVSGSGTIVMGANGVLFLIGGGSLSQGISGAGTLDLLSGSYSLGTGTLSVSHLTIGAGASLSGSGTLSNTIANSGTLMAQGGTLTVDGALAGGGAISAAAGAELNIAGGAVFSGAISGAGTVLIGSTTMLDQGASLSAAEVIDEAQVTLGASESITNGAGSVLMLSASSAPGADDARHRAQIEISGATGDTLTNAGMLIASGTGSEVVAVAFQNSGLVSVTGGILRFNKEFSGGGTLAVSAGAVLDIAGGGSTFAGAIGGAGTVRFDGVTTLNAGATLSAARAIETNNLKLGNGESLTIQAGDNYYLTATPPTTDTAPHRAQIELSGFKGDTFTNLGSVIANGVGTEEFGVSFVNTGHLYATMGTLSFLGSFSGTGLIAASAGATVDLTGTASIAGAMTGAGTLRFDNATTLLSGASIAVANIVETDNLTLGSSESLTNRAGDIYTITTGTTAAADPPHRAQIEVSGATGDTFSNAGTLAVNGSGSATFSLAVVNSGLTSVSAGAISFLGAVTNSGTVSVAGATASFSLAVGGTGTLDVGASGTLSLLAGAGLGQTVDFLTGSGLVNLTTPLDFAGAVSGFGAGDVIDLVNTAETSFAYANNTLTVKSGTAVVASVKFDGSYTKADFSITADSGTGHQITFV